MWKHVESPFRRSVRTWAVTGAAVSGRTLGTDSRRAWAGLDNSAFLISHPEFPWAIPLASLRASGEEDSLSRSGL